MHRTMNAPMQNDDERGIALISTLLIMMMISALLIGFTTMTVSDQRYRFIDRDRNQSFYAAGAGLEKLTTDLGNLFFVNVAPTAGQISSLTAAPPTIPNVNFTKSDGTSGYQLASQYLGMTTIQTGPYSGLYALITEYTMDVTARTLTGGDTHLQRKTQTVAIPVFQFGIFSDVDLSFSAADDFDFGGRVHTNGNLFLAQGGGSGSTLTLRDKVTAVKDIVRQTLSNGVDISDTGSTRTVSMAQGGGAFRNLARTEGSLVDGVGSARNEPPPKGTSSGFSWTTLSLSTYNSYIRDGDTGARVLNLPLIGIGGANTDLTRRPLPNEQNDNPLLYAERLYKKASLRILLSDTAADITNLPGVTATAPVSLENWSTTPYAGFAPSATRPPVAVSPGATDTTLNGGVAANAGTLTVPNSAATDSFKPVLTIGTMTNIVCKAKTATTFTGCTGITNSALTGATVSSGSASTTLVLPVLAGANAITVLSTTNFVPTSFWLAKAAGATQPAKDLVTCTGYTATTFTGCAGVPAAANGSRITTNALTTKDTGVIGGWIKIEKQSTAGAWSDVTLEILNWGIGGPNLDGKICGDPTPNAILRLQRLRDNAKANTAGNTCEYAATVNATDYWPNTLFDAREALMRDIDIGGAADDVTFGGLMHYIALDVDNVAEWFAGQGVYAGGNGTGAISDNGFTVYFSDRRNNRNSLSEETGEYGWEDYVNNGVANGVPNGTLDAGEDVNANGTLDVYGGFPNYNGNYNSLPPGWPAGTYRPYTFVTPSRAMVNRAIIFRRALKLINGANIVDSIPGLTIATENPVYVQGNYNNVSTTAWNATNAATAIIADAVTMLSGGWNDNNSFTNPYSTAGRPRPGTSVWYRVAIIAGKPPIFTKPSDIAGGSTFGTDGGVHSFLRFLEGDGANDDVHYQGSMATFYYNRQAVGPFKCCGAHVYDVPTRFYEFDLDFLNPALLPPNTPMFRDVNTIGFSQEIRPGR